VSRENPTVSEVNAAIREAGGKEILTSSGDYYYFRNLPGGATSSGVCVYRCNQLPMDRWLRELQEKREEVKGMKSVNC
jgi:hypothetical protein